MLNNEIVNTVSLGANKMVIVGRHYNKYHMLFTENDTAFAITATPNLFAKMRTELKFAYNKSTESRVLIWHEDEDDSYTYSIQFKGNKKNKDIVMSVTYEHMDILKEITVTLGETMISELHKVFVSNLSE